MPGNEQAANQRWYNTNTGQMASIGVVYNTSKDKSQIVEVAVRNSQKIIIDDNLPATLCRSIV